jgi:hypothetical protein
MPARFRRRRSRLRSTRKLSDQHLLVDGRRLSGQSPIQLILWRPSPGVPITGMLTVMPGSLPD